MIASCKRIQKISCKRRQIWHFWCSRLYLCSSNASNIELEKWKIVGISTYLEINQKYFLFQGYLLWGLSHLPEVKGMTRQFHLWNRLEAQPGSKTRICNFKLKSTQKTSACLNSLVLLPCQLMKRQLICQKLVRKLLIFSLLFFSVIWNISK